MRHFLRNTISVFLGGVVACTSVVGSMLLYTHAVQASPSSYPVLSRLCEYSSRHDSRYDCMQYSPVKNHIDKSMSSFIERIQQEYSTSDLDAMLEVIISRIQELYAQEQDTFKQFIYELILHRISSLHNSLHSSLGEDDILDIILDASETDLTPSDTNAVSTAKFELEPHIVQAEGSAVMIFQDKDPTPTGDYHVDVSFLFKNAGPDVSSPYTVRGYIDGIQIVEESFKELMRYTQNSLVLSTELPAGTYTATFIIDPDMDDIIMNNNTYSRTFTVAAGDTSYDIATYTVGNPGLVYSFSDIASDDRKHYVRTYYRFHNQGPGTSDPFSVHFELDGQEVYSKSYDKLFAGSQTSTLMELYLAAGTYELTSYIHSSNLDINPDNQRETITLNIEPQNPSYDLRTYAAGSNNGMLIQQRDFSPDNQTHLVEFSYFFINAGPSMTEDFDIACYIDNQKMHTSSQSRLDSGVQSGVRYRVNLKPGVYEFMCEIEDTFYDSDLSNNSHSTIFTVE